MDSKIVEKIQKLLSLANSSNENEAKSATNKANELLLKYNLNLQEVEDHQNEYGIQNIAETGLTIKPHQNMITDLLQKYFFVKILIGRKYVGTSSGKWAYYKPARSQYKKIIKLVGTSENCQIAAYIFSYLNEAYPRLFQEYYELNSHVEKTNSHKSSYWLGLTKGISKMLDETKWKVQNETGLVLKSDPKLREFLDKHSDGTYGGSSGSEIDPDIFKDGVRDGKKLTLRKPLETDRESQGDTKFLKGGS